MLRTCPSVYPVLRSRTLNVSIAFATTHVSSWRRALNSSSVNKGATAAACWFLSPRIRHRREPRSAGHNPLMDDALLPARPGMRSQDRRTIILIETCSIDAPKMRRDPRLARSNLQKAVLSRQPQLHIPSCTLGDKGIHKRRRAVVKILLEKQPRNGRPCGGDPGIRSRGLEYGGTDHRRHPGGRIFQ